MIGQITSLQTTMQGMNLPICYNMERGNVQCKFLICWFMTKCNSQLHFPHQRTVNNTQKKSKLFAQKSQNPYLQRCKLPLQTKKICIKERHFIQ